MTEAGMSPERQGWFAGLKEKVRKSFTIQGSKEKFYQNNAELIAKATANLTPEDKQAAYAQIEQDALSSAKLDVAAHWGALVLGTTVAGLGGGLITNVGGMRDRIGGMGKLGEKMANAGKRAHDSLSSMVRKFNFRREGSSVVRGKGPINVDAVAESIKEADKLKVKVATLKRAAESGRYSGAALDQLRLRIAEEQQRIKNLLNPRLEADQVRRLTDKIKDAGKAGKPVDILKARRTKAASGMDELRKVKR